MNVNLKQRFQEILEDNRILEAELMSRHTTFRIGGPADFFLVPENADEIKKIIAVCKEENVPYFILGNGSNLLVSDKGYQGVVVQLYRNFLRSELKTAGSMPRQELFYLELLQLQERHR